MMADAVAAERAVVVRSGDGLHLHVRRWDPPAPRAATVVLLHGANEHGARYPVLIQRLTDAGYRVIAPDQRGHGKSEGQRGNVDRFERLLEDIEAVLDEPAVGGGTRPVRVIGYSTGGLVATEFALRRPARTSALIVAAPAFGTGSGVPWPALVATRVLARVAPSVGLVRMNPHAMSTDPAEAAAYLVDPDVYHGRVRAGLVGAATARMRDLPARIGRLSAPLLVLHGGRDQHASLTASRRILAAAGSADKTLIEYPSARHDLFHEPFRTSARVTGDLVGWLGDRQ